MQMKITPKWYKHYFFLQLTTDDTASLPTDIATIWGNL